MSNADFEAGWSLTPVATPEGVMLVLELPPGPDRPKRIELRLDRADGLKLAQGIRAACGDAFERTFPSPLEQIQKETA